MLPHQNRGKARGMRVNCVRARPRIGAGDAGSGSLPSQPNAAQRVTPSSYTLTTACTPARFGLRGKRAPRADHLAHVRQRHGKSLVGLIVHPGRMEWTPAQSGRTMVVQGCEESSGTDAAQPQEPRAQSPLGTDAHEPPTSPGTVAGQGAELKRTTREVPRRASSRHKPRTPRCKSPRGRTHARFTDDPPLPDEAGNCARLRSAPRPRRLSRTTPAGHVGEAKRASTTRVAGARCRADPPDEPSATHLSRGGHQCPADPPSSPRP